MVGKTKQFLSFVLPGVIKPVRILWNEMMGFIFLCLGLIPLPSAIRAYRDYADGGQGMFRLVLTGIFCSVMLYFGVSSFLKAKRIGKS
ncbi:MAG: hypothetical protein IANPNBLG_02975 [Bryobacteraceae bacterium]|nr:hypothetical protein [Bryobacteraceae bacterium]MCC6342239.1 hypothetical protein [Bryobacterales bacterium]